MNRLSLKFTLLWMLVITSCIVLNNRVEKIELTDLAQFNTKSNLRVHMHDGSMLDSKQGVRIIKHTDSVYVIPAIGAMRYDLYRNPMTVGDTINISEIAFVENYTKPLSLASVPATVAGYFGSLVAYVAIFGSCPTYYSESDQGTSLEGEGFSYSIAPRFEEDDLDKVSSHHQSDGSFTLKVRNEAWETHYINHLELVCLDHAAEYEAFSTVKKGKFFDQSKSVLLVGKPIESLQVADKSGKDVTPLLRFRDSKSYRSETLVIEQMKSDPGTEDWIECEFRVPKTQGEFFITFKLRNTLLNSFLLYEHLLDKQNFGAIDWIAEDQNGLTETLKFYKWYTQHFGLKIDQARNGEFVQVESLRDLGPTAWSHIAVPIKTNGTGAEKIRIRFIPDNWEIDWLAVSLDGIKNPNTFTAPLTSALHNEEDISSEIRKLIKQKDRKYLIIFPGEEYLLNFHPRTPEVGLIRSYFIRSEGYYTEWLRPRWLMPDIGEGLQEDLVLNEALLKSLYKSWSEKKETFEGNFFASKIQ